MAFYYQPVPVTSANVFSRILPFIQHGSAPVAQNSGMFNLEDNKERLNWLAGSSPFVGFYFTKDNFEKKKTTILKVNIHFSSQLNCHPLPDYYPWSL